MNPTIRFATPRDMSSLIALCEAHAQYEKVIYHPKNKALKLASDMFSEVPKLYGLVVEQEGQLIGYATYMIQYATWNAEEYVYMDCLYLSAEARGLGIGKKLIHRIQEEAKALHCTSIQWQTPNFNTRAIAFYEAIGATSLSKARFFLTV